MTVKATFIADFSSFTAAVEKAEAKLVDFEQDAGKVGKALDRMVDNFNGRKIVQEAILMSKAIEEAGGTARLTASQLEQVGNKANEAANKLRLMGKDVPPGLQKIVTEVQKIQAEAQKLQTAVQPLPSTFDKMFSAAGPLGAAMAGAFSVTAIIGFGKKILDTANDLVKMSDQTGIGVVALQRLDAIAQASGNSLEDIAGAVNKFQKGVAEGKLNDPIERIGLSVQKLREQSPDEQFISIAKAIQGISDPAEQARAAMELFGRSGGALLPSLKADVEALANSTVQMSAESVKALDDLGDSMGRLKTSTINTFGEILGKLLTLPKAIQDAQANLDKLTPLQRNTPEHLSQGQILNTLENEQPGGSAAIQMDDFQKSVADATDAIPKLSSALKPLGLAIIDMDTATMHANKSLGTLQEQLKKAEAAEALAKALDAVNKKIADATAPISELTDAQKIAATGYRELGLSVQDIAIKLGVTATSVKAFQATVDLQKATLIATTKAFKDYLVVIPQVGSQSQAIENILNGLTYDGLLPASDTVEKFNKHLLDFKDIGHQASGTMAEFHKEAEKAAEKSAKANDSIDGLARAFAQIAQVSGLDSGVVQQIGNIVTSFDLATKAAKAFGEATTLAGKAAAVAAGVAAVAQATGSGSTASRVLGGAAAGAQAGSIAGPYGALIGAGVGALVGWIRSAHAAERATNDLRDQFVALHGDINKLNKEAQDAGLTLDRMLDAKTPADFTAAMNELNTAIAHHAEILSGAEAFGLNTDELKAAADKAAEVYEYVRDSGKYAASQIEAAFIAAEEAAAAAGDTAAQAWLDARNAATTGAAAVSAALDELQKKRDGLSQSIANEAPEAVMGSTEAGIRAQIADVDREIEAARRRAEEAAATAEPIAIPANLVLTVPADQTPVPDVVVPAVIDMQDWKARLDDAGMAAVNEFQGAADDMTKALKTVDVPTIHVPVVFDYPAFEAPEPGGNVQHFATGGIVLPFRGRTGTDSVPAMLTPGEQVLTKEQQAQRTSATAAATHLHVYLGDREIASYIYDATNAGGTPLGKFNGMVKRVFREQIA